MNEENQDQEDYNEQDDEWRYLLKYSRGDNW